MITRSYREYDKVTGQIADNLGLDAVADMIFERDDRIEELEREIERLQEELRDALEQIAEAKP